MTDTPAPGQTTIAPEVLLSVAKLTALDVEGVAHLSSRPASVNRLLRRTHHASDGVQVAIQDGKVTVDIYAILDSDVNIRQVSKKLQQKIARAFTEMVGMDVNQINIHIEDIAEQA